MMGMDVYAKNVCFVMFKYALHPFSKNPTHVPRGMPIFLPSCL